MNMEDSLYAVIAMEADQRAERKSIWKQNMSSCPSVPEQKMEII